MLRLQSNLILQGKKLMHRKGKEPATQVVLELDLAQARTLSHTLSALHWTAQWPCPRTVAVQVVLCEGLCRVCLCPQISQPF
jgi:hypothetical protein